LRKRQRTMKATIYNEAKRLFLSKYSRFRCIVVDTLSSRCDVVGSKRANKRVDLSPSQIRHFHEILDFAGLESGFGIPVLSLSLVRYQAASFFRLLGRPVLPHPARSFFWRLWWSEYGMDCLVQILRFCSTYSLT